LKLKNKNVIITGSTGGLGSALAFKYLNEGANLILIGRTDSKLNILKTKLVQNILLNQFVITIKLDLSNLNSIPKIINKELKKLPKVDILINCAAIQGPIGKSWENSFKDWEKSFNINFYSTMVMTNTILPFMLKNNSGSIINISGGGSTSSRPDFSSYAISKTALVRYTEILSDELSNTKIRVNSISPGVMATNMIKQVIKYKKNIKNKNEVISADKVLSEGDNKDNAINLCIFLSTKESNGINGKLISALWDPWNEFKKYKSYIANSDIYTLRRIIPKDRGMNWPLN
jgi:short-subunit dehydrogenase